MVDAADRGKVRLLINDTNEASYVFADAEIDSFLELEDQSVKLAAAQALDVIADDEVLTAKVIRDSDGKSTDGAKVADSLRKRAAALREQAESDGSGHFEIVDMGEPTHPELTGTPWHW